MLFSRPIPRGPRVHSILTTHPWVLEAMTARKRADVSKLIGITAHCIADCQMHGESHLAAHYQDILVQQHKIWLRLSDQPLEPEPHPKPKRGRRKGTYDIPNDELFWQMFDARMRWFAKHPSCNELTQDELLEEMNCAPETDSKRVREWCTRLKISWTEFRRRG
jgi:hypothetical protein